MNPVLLVLAIVFVATLIRSIFGFGEGLFAVPLLAFCIPVTQAAPLVALLSITIAAIVVVQDWNKIHLHVTGWLVFPTFLGIPLGILLLGSRHPKAVKAALATVIIAFSAYSLIGRNPPELRHDNRLWMLICGFIAGILGGAYGMNGPPLAIYGAMRRWSAQHFRATLQGYFLPASLAGAVGYWLAGLWTPIVTRYYLLSLPLAVIAILAGRAINRRLQGRAFVKYVYAGLLCIGTLLFVQAMSGRF
jgi:uncharacterized membrane protein YfcA